MNGTILNYSDRYKSIQIKNPVFNEQNSWFEVPESMLDIFQNTQKGQELDFTWDINGKKKTLKTFIPINIGNNDLKPANQMPEKNEYRERKDAKEDLILKQAVGKIAVELMKGINEPLKQEELITVFKKMSKQIRTFMLSDWDSD